MRVPIWSGGTTALATGLLNPSHIAVDSTDVYFATLGTSPQYAGDGSIAKVPKGGGAVTPLATGQPYVRGLAVTGGSVVWGTDTAIYKVSTGGGVVETLTASGTSALGVDASTVYFGTGSSSKGYRLQSVSASGGAVSTLAILPKYASAVAVSGSNVYYAFNSDTLGVVPK